MYIYFMIYIHIYILVFDWLSHPRKLIQNLESDHYHVTSLHCSTYHSILNTYYTSSIKWTKYSQKRIYGNWHANKDLGHLKSIIGNGNTYMYNICNLCLILNHGYHDSKVHGVNVGPIWGRQDPGGPHFGPMNFAIWVRIHTSWVPLKNKE